MIAYLDTSALLKLYLDEGGSDRVQRMLGEATAACTLLLSYAELRAALAQAVRMRRISEETCAQQVARFEADWLTLHVISVDERLVRRAGELAERFGLRGYDSVHLAAAEQANDAAGRIVPFVFAAFDAGLNRAAEGLGLELLN
ncbi:MAG: type II toxin-antitoxin system VapC family toxin [Woeseia sp.]